jgi:hypothetical protein
MRKFGLCTRFSNGAALLNEEDLGLRPGKARSAAYQAQVARRSGGAPERTQGYALTGDLAFARLKSPLPRGVRSVGLFV